MFHTQRKIHPRTILISLGFLCFMMLTHCSGPEVRLTPQGRIPSHLPPTASEKDTVIQPPITTATIPETSTMRPSSPGFDSSTQIGWLLTTRDPKIAVTALDNVTPYNIRAIHLGGDILQAVDDLIFIPELNRFVQTLSSRAKEKGISTYIWSRELHLEGKTFSFNSAAPLVVARQAAYRNALSNLPDVAGVVLSFQGAELEPWNAVIPEGQPMLPNPERIRFLIEMVRKVVVDELGKQLLIYMDATGPEQKSWITEAVQFYPSGTLSLLHPAVFPPAFPTNSSPALQTSTSTYPQWLLYDLVASTFFGDRFLFCMADELAHIIKEARKQNLRGGIGKIDAKGYSLVNSPNEVNLFIFSRLLSLPNASLDSILDEWIEQRYNLMPSTPLGRMCKQFLHASAAWGRKMIQVKDLPVLVWDGDIPLRRESFLAGLNQIGMNQPALATLMSDILTPQKQTLVDIAQEAFEVCEGLGKFDRTLESLRSDMNPNEYAKLRPRLDYQRRVADVFFYAKQCLWGFRLWEPTMDEAEALYLEAHLQRLEHLASEIEQKYGPELSPANPNRIRALVADLRHAFPRVLLGARERPWNHLRNIEIKPSGAVGVEITWESDELSISRVFAGTQPWVFSTTITGPNSPGKTHRMVVERLQPGNFYFFKIQCTTEKGEITNSGDFPYYFELQPAM